MVIRTPTLNSLKRGFLPQIHQPLPLSRRESQQLLDSITSSFRKNLDKEHPWQSAEDTTTATTTTPPTKEDESSLKTTKHRPTDRHLREILSNPLFSHPQQNDSTSSPSIPTKNPFDVFDAAVAKGMMTTRRAAGFLATIRAQAVKQSSPDVRPNLATTGAGLHVLQWLRSSGQEDNLRFLSDSTLIQQLLPFMYAEGLEEVAWTWLAKLAAHRLRSMGLESGHTKLTSHPLFSLLSSMMKENSQSAAESKLNLDGSYSTLLRADQMLPKDYRVASLSVKNAWTGLSWASTVNAWERPKPSTPLFESFVDLGRPFDLPLDLAHLELHHPTTPSSDSAVHYMHTRFAKAQDVTNTTIGDRARRRLICLALDTVDRLKQSGNTTEASWVERFLTKMCENLNLGILNMNLTDSIASDRPLYRLN